MIELPDKDFILYVQKIFLALFICFYLLFVIILLKSVFSYLIKIKQIEIIFFEKEK